MDVNLWSKAGRKSGRPIGGIRKFEEIQVLNVKRLANGETWFKVQLLRYPDGKKVESIGWVDAKFFTEIETPVAADQPAAGSTEAKVGCPNCTSNSYRESTINQVKDIGAAISGSSKFTWPVGGYVRSGYGYRRHPIKGVVRLHKGTDISGNAGAKVRASKGGRVEVSASGCRPGRKSCNGGAGNMITIDHGDGTKTRYLHLNQNCALPKRGATIARGAALGCVGATGAVTGPHLHFEVIKNGRWVNPLTVLPRRD